MDACREKQEVFFINVEGEFTTVGTPNPTWVGVECEKSQWSPSDLGI